MEQLDKAQLINLINGHACKGEPFVFVTDFKGEKGYFFEMENLQELNISLSIEGKELGKELGIKLKVEHHNISLKPGAIPIEEYVERFERAKKHILLGDSYLMNLTFATALGGDLSFQSIYHSASAKYKMMLPEEFVFYSPETFIQIHGSEISSYPMKGTISAHIDDAQQKLIEDPKELYEHYTIVDLLRNDLAMVARDVRVERFRYVEKIDTPKGAIFQTSSHITATLSDNWQSRLGDIIFTMLPAGSICGAPKAKTVSIIGECEKGERGFYTGVMGYFDGESFDSAVMIRFIAKDRDGEYYYHSGGGITSRSQAQSEYNELISKIYVPIL